MYRQLRVPRNFLAGVATNSEAKVIAQQEVNDPLLTSESNIHTQKTFMDFFSKFSKLRWLSMITAGIHLFSAVLLMILYFQRTGDKPISRVNRVAVCWGNSMNMTNHIDTEPSAGIDRLDSIAVLIITFFFLSAIFQGWASWNVNYDKNIEKNLPQYYRYTEYSVSASLMIVSIFMSFGLLDSYLHTCVFFLTFLCMMMGLAADVIRDILKQDFTVMASALRQVVVYLHYLSWVPMLIPWIILLVSVIDLQSGFFKNTCNVNLGLSTNFAETTENSLPWFVWFIFAVQCILFSIFGCVQQLQFSDEFIFSISYWRNDLDYLSKNPNYNAAETGIRTEKMFLVLSLTAKSLLGWTIFSQVLVA